MANDGWTWTFETDKVNSLGSSSSGNCLSDKFHGFDAGNSGNDEGEVKYTFTEKGVAVLEFGNCWVYGQVKVYLNDIEIDSVGILSSKTTHFTFTFGDELKVKDTSGNSVVQLKRMTTFCPGTGILFVKFFGIKLLL